MGKISSFAAIAISFEKDENENTFNLIDIILRQGINVYIESENIYNEFKQHRFFDYLVLIENVKNIEHIKNYIVVISTDYININLKSNIKSSDFVLFFFLKSV